MPRVPCVICGEPVRMVVVARRDEPARVEHTDPLAMPCGLTFAEYRQQAKVWLRAVDGP